jgi:hypothetical protein
MVHEKRLVCASSYEKIKGKEKKEIAHDFLVSIPPIPSPRTPRCAVINHPAVMHTSSPCHAVNAVLSLLKRK